MKKAFNKNKTVFLIALTILLSVTFAQAQPGGQQRGQQGPPPLPDEEQITQMVVDLSETLTLNEEQERQVKKAFTDHFKEVDQIRERSRKYQEAQRKDMERVRSNFQEEVKSYLTEEQKLQFDAYQKGQQSKRQNKGNKGKQGKRDCQ